MKENESAPTPPPQNDDVRPPAPEHENLYHALIGRVLGPYYPRLLAWIRHLSWKKAVLVLIGVGCITTLGRLTWEYRTSIGNSLSLAWYFWDARHAPADWKDDNRAQVLSDMSEYVKDEFAVPRRGSPDGRHNAWTEAQMRVALDQLGIADDPDLFHWFEGKEAKCHCWRQHPESTEDHIGATAWVLLAFSRMKQKPTELQIEFITSNQHSGGWWPQYPSMDREENASTYATAMSVWALHELSRRDLVPNKQKTNVESTIQAGRDWLISHNVKDRPGIWRDYQAGYAWESIGISGLVVHVLHTMEYPPPPSIDEYWMANLPADLPPVEDQVNSGQPIALARGGTFTDSTHNFTLPWLVIATTDAYPRGSIGQRANAARLLKQLGNKRDEIRRGVQDSPWFAAEILMSLRYIRGEKII